jgi:hypothetical protein
MVVENITQRQDEPFEVSESLALIRKYLKLACSDTEQAKHKDIKGVQEQGSIRNISEWLNTNGEVMSKSKIDEY